MKGKNTHPRKMIAISRFKNNNNNNNNTRFNNTYGRKNLGSWNGAANIREFNPYCLFTARHGFKSIYCIFLRFFCNLIKFLCQIKHCVGICFTDFRTPQKMVDPE